MNISKSVLLGCDEYSELLENILRKNWSLLIRSLLRNQENNTNIDKIESSIIASRRPILGGGIFDCYLDENDQVRINYITPQGLIIEQEDDDE